MFFEISDPELPIYKKSYHESIRIFTFKSNVVTILKVNKPTKKIITDVKSSYGFVYFTKDVRIGDIKIGREKKNGSRIITFNAGINVSGQYVQILSCKSNDAVMLEKLFHKFFTAKRLTMDINGIVSRTEFFKLTIEDISNVRDLKLPNEIVLLQFFSIIKIKKTPNNGVLFVIHFFHFHSVPF